MRCDLHVHSWYSGRAEVPVLEHVGRECYSHPLEVHDRACRRGMDLVTLTDHDTIEGAISLAHFRETFVSEEVTVHLDGGRRLHVNVFDLDERQHVALQARRRDFEAFVAFLAEERLPASINNLFSALTGARELADLRLPLGRLPLIEALNGALPETLRDALSGHLSALRIAASLAMAPFLATIPLFTLAVHAHERGFGARHFRAFQQAFGWPTLPSQRPAAAFTPSLEEAA